VFVQISKLLLSQGRIDEEVDWLSWLDLWAKDQQFHILKCLNNDFDHLLKQIRSGSLTIKDSKLNLNQV